MAKPKAQHEQPALFGAELAPVPEPVAVEALAIWNAIAPGAGWPEAKFLTASRRTAIKRAVADYGGLLGWKAHLTTAATSDFLTGKSGRSGDHVNWRPDFDWFLKPSSVIKILENKFRGVAPSASVAQIAPANRGTDWRGRLERYRKGSFWHKETEGNRPEDPAPHLAPAEMIEKWRKTHGIVEKAAPADETEEQRLTSSIASLRTYGKWDRANAAEERLAALQKRPPVLVPAPDVAGVGMPGRPDLANSGHSRPSGSQSGRNGSQTGPGVGHNRPPGPITDLPFDDAPPWDDAIPEGDPAQAEP